jgi:hypothetical protein
MNVAGWSEWAGLPYGKRGRPAFFCGRHMDPIKPAANPPIQLSPETKALLARGQMALIEAEGLGISLRAALLRAAVFQERWAQTHGPWVHKPS